MEGNPRMNECDVCSNPQNATFEERVAHGCITAAESLRCEWCGKAQPKSPTAIEPWGFWCNEACASAHKAANPECDWFRGFAPILDTLPGGRFDGVWENSGLRLVNKDDGLQ